MPAPRVCAQPGCPTLVPKAGRCPAHTRTTTQRGYGAPHQRERARAVRTYDPTDPCPRCHEPLGDDPDALHLDHDDNRTGYLGPSGLSHAACNLQAGGRARHAHPGGRPPPTPTDQ